MFDDANIGIISESRNFFGNFFLSPYFISGKKCNFVVALLNSLSVATEKKWANYKFKETDMKRELKMLFLLLAIAPYGICGFAQEPVLSFDGELSFIPGSMTKDGEAFMVSVNNSGEGRIIVYDGDFKVVRDFTDPTAGRPYQQRVVTMTRIYDPSSDGWGPTTRGASDEWTVVDDQTTDYTTSSGIVSFELFSDNNNYHSRYLYVSQTLFDDDEEFEYVRRKQAIVPITMKYSDYAKEHSTGNETYFSIVYGDEKIDSLMKATGASDYQWFWDEDTGKRLIRLIKYEYYGGVYNEGIEIVATDGSVKVSIPGIDSFSSAYYFRGKCYVEGYDNNNRVLYLLGNSATGIRELSRTKASLSIKRVDNNLIVDSDSNEQQTVVMSTMDGRIVRSLNVRQGSNTIPLNGLLGGVYCVTLYRCSQPLKSSKIVIK